MTFRPFAATRGAHERAFRKRYGRWAVVTGASSGIGNAFAHAVAARRMNVVLVARRPHVLERTAAELSERYAVEALALPLDVGDEDGHHRLLAQTEYLDAGLLVAAAGFGTSGDFLTLDERDEVEMLAVNCTAVLRQCRDFGRRFAKRGRGGIILMGSLLGFQGVPRSANYAATKAYVQVLAEGVRTELRPLGVDIVCSAPGPIKSGFETRADMRMTMGALPPTVADATLRALGRRTTITPGALSKLLTYSLAPLPRGMRTRILGAVMADMTKHQAR